MEIAIALTALTVMEIVLGIDNIIFITIISGRLPADQQPGARRIGLALALLTRLGLLATLSYVVHQLNRQPLFELTQLGFPEELLRRLVSLDGHTVSPERFVESNGVTWRDVILFGGGLFLIYKSVHEIHSQFSGHEEAARAGGGRRRFATVIAQIAVLDIVFSLDSVITAVGMVDQLWVMATAIVLAIGVMLVFAEPIARFVSRQPTIKMLALSFLILIGVVLVADALGSHVDKGYIYFAMAFSVVVEFLNLALRRRRSEHRPAAA